MSSSDEKILKEIHTQNNAHKNGIAYHPVHVVKLQNTKEVLEKVNATVEKNLQKLLSKKKNSNSHSEPELIAIFKEIDIKNAANVFKLSSDTITTITRQFNIFRQNTGFFRLSTASQSLLIRIRGILTSLPFNQKPRIMTKQQQEAFELLIKDLNSFIPIQKNNGVTLSSPALSAVHPRHVNCFPYFYSPSRDHARSQAYFLKTTTPVRLNFAEEQKTPIRLNFSEDQKTPVKRTPQKNMSPKKTPNKTATNRTPSRTPNKDPIYRGENPYIDRKHSKDIHHPHTPLISQASRKSPTKTPNKSKAHQDDLSKTIKDAIKLLKNSIQGQKDILKETQAQITLGPIKRSPAKAPPFPEEMEKMRAKILELERRSAEKNLQEAQHKKQLEEYERQIAVLQKEITEREKQMLEERQKYTNVLLKSAAFEAERKEAVAKRVTAELEKSKLILKMMEIQKQYRKVKASSPVKINSSLPNSINRFK